MTGILWKNPFTFLVWNPWRTARFQNSPAAQEAHVLLLDEPFTGLDAPASQSLGRLLDSLAAEGRLVIASHHDLNTVADIFDTILLMNRDLAAFGPPKEVLTPARIRETYGMEPQPEIQAS